jgi:glutaminyl-peptide cyclotransferase
LPHLDSKCERIIAVRAHIIAALLVSCGCNSPPGADAAPPRDPAIDHYVPEVIRTLPHDPTAFTQGLAFRENHLYESTGRYGASTLRVIDAHTGSVVRRLELAPNVFAEGLAFTDQYLVQLTWKEMLAYYYDPVTLTTLRTASYLGEGWGICYDGLRLYMTSGGDQLIIRDPNTFEPISTIAITQAGMPLFNVNELECVDKHIWANVYLTTRLVQIDKVTGRVIGELDASSLVPAGIQAQNPDYVLNGIAHSPETGTYFLTGKLWPAIFEVRFVRSK